MPLFTDTLDYSKAEHATFQKLLPYLTDDERAAYADGTAPLVIQIGLLRRALDRVLAYRSATPWSNGRMWPERNYRSVLKDDILATTCPNVLCLKPAGDLREHTGPGDPCQEVDYNRKHTVLSSPFEFHSERYDATGIRLDRQDALALLACIKETKP